MPNDFPSIVDLTDVQTDLKVQGQMTQVNTDREMAFKDNLAEDFKDQQRPEAASVAGAMYMQETILGSLWDQGREYIEGAPISNRDDTFNQFSHYKQNAAEYGDVERYVRDGEFDGIRSAPEFKAKADAIRRELGNKETIAQGGTAGLVLGTVLSFADLSTLVPFYGEYARGATGVKAMAVFAANAAGITAAQELALHGMQNTRTPIESLMNVGIGTVIGGGLGVFSHLAARGGPLHPAAEHNPLDVSNQAHYQDIPAGSSPNAVGADAVKRDFQTPADEASLGFMDHVTPAGRVKYISDGETRDMMYGIAEISGYTKQDVAGVARPSSAELINDIEYQPKAAAQLETFHRMHREINMEFGDQSPLGTSLREQAKHLPGMKSQNALSLEDWNRSVVFKTFDPDYRFEHANPNLAKLVNKKLDEMDATTKKYHGYFAKRSVELGLMKESDLRDDYGMTVIHNSDAIRANPLEWERLVINDWMKKPDEDWLAELDMDRIAGDLDPAYVGKRGFTERELDALPKDSPVRTAIAREFEDDKLFMQQMVAEADLGKAVDDLKAAKSDAIKASRDAKKAETKDARLSIRAAKADEETNQLELHLAREERDQLRKEKDAIFSAAEAARSTTLARQEQFTDVKPEAGESIYKSFTNAKAKRETALTEMEGFFKNTLLTRTEAGTKVQSIGTFNEDGFAKLSEKFTTADQRLKKVMAKTGKVTFAKAAEPTDTPLLATLRERARMTDKMLREVDRKVADVEARVKVARDNLEAAKLKATEARDIRKARTLEARERSKELAGANKDLKRAKRVTKALDTATTMPERVRDVRRILEDQTLTPNGVLDPNEIVASGRTKHRNLKVSKETMKAFIDRGFVKQNYEDIIQRYAHDMGPRLALREKFGTDNLKEAFDKVAVRYDGLILDASESGNTKLVEKLQKERDLVLNEESGLLVGLWKRVMGVYRLPAEPHGFWAFSSRMARKFAYTTSMGGVMLSSITDGATMQLKNNGLARTLTKGFSAKVLKDLKEMPQRELEVILGGSENFAQLSRNAKLMQLDENLHQLGFGSGMVRKISAKVEGGLNYAVAKMPVLNGMAIYNSWNKRVSSGIFFGWVQEMGEKSAKGAALSRKEIRELAYHGIDLDDLSRIHAMHAKHSVAFHGDGLLKVPVEDEWLKAPGGRELYRRLVGAAKRAMDEAVITPGVADTPFWMSHAAGRVLGQFQTFGFAAQNKFVKNLKYRMGQGELEAFASASTALMLGSLVYTIKENVIGGRKLSDKPATWVYEAIDRSGLAAWMMPFLNSGAKLLAPATQAAGMDFMDVPSRYRQASWLAGLLGPSFSMLENVQGLGTALANGDLDRAQDKAGRLTIYRNLFYITGLLNLSDGAE